MAAKTPSKVAVVGAGLAGAACSSQLAVQGKSVALFDMGGRGPGGRTSTRKQSGYQFDHGCQYIQPPGDQRLQDAFQTWEREGALAKWTGSFGIIDKAKGSWRADSGRTLLVGNPSMDSLVKHMAAQHGIDQNWAFKVEKLELQNDGSWLVHGLQRHPGDEPDQQQTKGPFEAVLLADVLTFQGGVGGMDLGSEAAMKLLSPVGKASKKAPCFSLMAALNVGSQETGISAASVSGCDTLQWVACDSSKPGRERSDGLHCWVAVSTEEYARNTMAASGKPDMDAISQDLLQKLHDALLIVNPRLTAAQLSANFLAAQRWGSGFRTNCHPQPFIWDADLGIGAAGDFCIASSALQTISNGFALADAVAGHTSPDGGQKADVSSSAPGDMLRW